MVTRSELPQFTPYTVAELQALNLIRAEDIEKGNVTSDGRGGLFLRMSHRVRLPLDGPEADTWVKMHGSLDMMNTPIDALGELFPAKTLGPYDDLILQPRGFALGITEAALKIPLDMGGFFTPHLHQRRSSGWFELVGVTSQLAPYVQPGHHGLIVLEIANRTRDTIVLNLIDIYAQLVFVRFNHPAEPYVGQFEGQTDIVLP